MRQEDFEALASFRLEIRRFMDFSRQFLTEAGVPPVQYQAMLALKAKGDRPYSIGDLAAELFIRLQTAVELVARMKAAGLVQRASAPDDRRRVLLTLTDRASMMLDRLAEQHFAQLRANVATLEASIRRFSTSGACDVNA